MRQLLYNYLARFTHLASITLKSPVKSFVFLSLIFGTIFIILQPPLSGSDEEAHFSRSYGITNGEFRLYKTDQVTVPKSFRKTIGCFQTKSPVEGRMYTYKYDEYGIDKKDAFRCAFSVPLEEDDTESVRTSAPGYSPTTYIPQSIAIVIGRMIDAPVIVMVYLIRLFVMIAYISLMVLALKILPVRRWSLVGIALLPISIIHFTNPGGDYMLLGLVAVFVSVVVRSMHIPKNQLKRENKVLISILTASALLMVLPKGIFPGICFLPLVMFYGGIRHDVAKKITIILLSVAVGYLWQKFGVSTILGRPNDEVNSLLEFPLAFMKTMFYGWSGTDFFHTGRPHSSEYGSAAIPSIMISLLNIAIAVYIFVLYPEKHRGKISKTRELVLYKWINVAVASFVIVGSFAALYIAGSYLQDDTGIIKGVQTRYFYPALISLALLPLWRPFNINSEKLYSYIVILCSAMLLLSQAIVICMHYKWGIF